VSKLVGAKLRKVIESTFTVISSRSSVKELAILCEQPGCGDQSGNRSVNLETGKTSCWRCGKGGNIIPWMRSLGHEPDLTNMDLYENREIDSMVGDLDSAYATKRSVVAYVNDVKLPRGFVKLEDEPDSGYAKLIRKMALRKNLDLETFIRAGAGFTREDPYWEPFCIFPVYEWGKVVYYQGRTYTDPRPDPETGKKPSTKKFPSKDELKLGSRYWIYNIDRLRKHGRIGIAVESMFNVYSLENKIGLDSDIVPFAIFKHKISPEQQAKLLTAQGVTELCLMFDPDAIASAWESCGKLANLMKVTVADKMPDGVDPNDDVDEALRCFDRRKKFSTVNDLDRLASGL
jgi:hypothetical protein